MARGRSGRKRRAGGSVRVKGHTRDPRGPNKGKKRVRVKGHRRRSPS